MDDRPDRSGNVVLTHFLMKHLVRSGNQKKKTRFAGLFFLPAFGRCCPSVSAHPAKVLLCTENLNACLHKSALALWSRQIRTYNVTNTQQQLRTTQQQLRTGLTGEAWPACRAGLFFLTGLQPVLPLGQCPPSKPYTV